MEQRRFGVLLITGGRTHQENYAAAFAADPRCRLVGLADEPDVSVERKTWNAELAKKLGVPLLPDLEAALARDDVQIVSVCAEPERRARMGALAARAGKHVYMDKPLGCRLVQVDDLVRAVSERRVKSQMFTLLRTASALRARRVAESGRLGELVAIHCDLLFAKGHLGNGPALAPRKETYPPERFTFIDSKREVWTTAIYPLAFIQWLTGRKFLDVRCVTGNYFFSEHARNDCDDYGSLLLRLEGGLTATITAGRIGWTSHRSAGPNRTVLVGTKATATIDAYQPRVEVLGSSPPWTPPPRNPDDPMGFWTSTQAAVGTKPKKDWQLLEADAKTDAAFFIDCLDGDKDSDYSVGPAAHGTEVIFAAYKSAAEGRTVTLPLPR